MVPFTGTRSKKSTQRNNTINKIAITPYIIYSSRVLYLSYLIAQRAVRKAGPKSSLNKLNREKPKVNIEK